MKVEPVLHRLRTRAIEGVVSASRSGQQQKIDSESATADRVVG